MSTFKRGDKVIVNTGGQDSTGVISDTKSYNPALKGCVLVSFDGTRSYSAQWIPEKYVRHAE